MTTKSKLYITTYPEEKKIRLMFPDPENPGGKITVIASEDETEKWCRAILKIIETTKSKREAKNRPQLSVLNGARYDGVKVNI